jgi:hypothetical protein
VFSPEFLLEKAKQALIEIDRLSIAGHPSDVRRINMIAKEVLVVMELNEFRKKARDRQ